MQSPQRLRSTPFRAGHALACCFFNVSAARLIISLVVALLIVPCGNGWADDSPDVPGAAWRLPLEGDCRGLSEPARGAQDSRPAAFDPLDVLEFDDLAQLERYLPPAVWSQHSRFFYEGMQIKIGACFRDYSPPAFFQRATQDFAGEAHLLGNGGLAGYTAGLPFGPESFAPNDPDAGQRWAWNFAHRYRAAGHRGRFRVSEVLSGQVPGRSFEGDTFVVRTAHRSDRSETGYRLTGSGDREWIAGGRFVRPHAAREFVWRQYRSAGAHSNPRQSDDIHAYIPAHHRVRRLNSSRVEGLFVPTNVVGTGGGSAGGLGGLLDEGIETAAVETGSRGGFEALEIRPLLHRYRVVGLSNVLAPINVRRSMYPDDPDRDFGPSGLSFANDQWDLRRALVLEETSRTFEGGGRKVYYLDLQTLTPLYYMVYDAEGQLVDVAVFAGRWSEDRPAYPAWPDQKEGEVRSLDSAAAVFANLIERSSWRRESWGMVSVHEPELKLERVLSVRSLIER